MQLQPYLFFDGRREEALEFYRRVLGAEVNELARFKDSHDPQERERFAIMHTCFRVGEAAVLASDGRRTGHPTFQGFAVSLLPNDEEAERVFATFTDGGQVQIPLAKTFFSSRFGMVADRFGVLWMVSVAP